MTEDTPLHAMPPAIGLAFILKAQPDFLRGYIANLDIKAIQQQREEAVDATDFLCQQFMAALGCIAIRAMGHPDLYDIQEEVNYDPDKDRMAIDSRTFSAKGFETFKADLIKAVQYLCNGSENYFILLRQSQTERGEAVNGSYERLELELLERCLKIKDGKVGFFDFTPRNDLTP